MIGQFFLVGSLGGCVEIYHQNNDESNFSNYGVHFDVVLINAFR